MSEQLEAELEDVMANRGTRFGSWARGWIGAAALACIAGPASAVTIDGNLTPGEYSFVYSIDYAWGPNGAPVSGGTIAFKQDAQGLHVYYGVPKSYVDNTWGCQMGTGATCSQIGKYRFAKHTFRKLWRSDSFGVEGSRMMLRGTSQGDVQFQMDIVASPLSALEAQGSGSQRFEAGGVGDDYTNSSLSNNNGWLMDAADASLFLDIQTSTANNIQRFGPGGTGVITQSALDNALVTTYKDRQGVFKDSPGTDTNYTDPTTDQSNTAYNDAAYSGWNYQVAFEMTLDASLFPNGEWIDPNNHVLVPCGDGRMCLPIWDFGGAHFSNNKFGTNTLLDPTAITLVFMPEPTTAVLLLLGLTGLASRRRS